MSARLVRTERLTYPGGTCGAVLWANCMQGESFELVILTGLDDDADLAHVLSGAQSQYGPDVQVAWAMGGPNFVDIFELDGDLRVTDLPAEQLAENLGVTVDQLLTAVS